jgi:hypothetical protein
MRLLSVTRRASPRIAFALSTLGLTWPPANEPSVLTILTSARARTTYLAHATIWKDPGSLSPDEILAGPRGVFPYTAAEARAGVDCTFLTRGKDLGGKTEKFLCATDDGRRLRVKYWDPEQQTGNREVLAIVAATRLTWTLGFDVLPALPVQIRCSGCPSNPMTGEGARRSRNYAAEISSYPPGGPMILSRDDHDQGWSWRELDDAIETLPPGPERTRQRTHFDALTLLGIFMQHGDRKPEQQALYCDAPVDMSASARQTTTARHLSSVLIERPESSACPRPAVALVDVGATFGGAGRTSSSGSATMNLDEWRNHTVFQSHDGGGCRGRLIVSMAAGRDGEGNPNISEDGRRFLLEQLRRLTPAHVRAIFTAARVDLLSRSNAVDEWVEAFQEKVREIEGRRCEPRDR